MVQIVKIFLKKMVNLLIIPGYSDKSGQWTFGKLNL